MNETTNDFFDAILGEEEAYYDHLDGRESVGLPWISFAEFKKLVQAATLIAPPPAEVSDESCPF